MGKISTALLATLLFGLLPKVARGEEPRVTVVGVTRERQDRAGKVLITQINRKDCIDDDQLGFELALEQYAGYSLEIWAGTGCEAATNRLSATAATCWQVYTATPSNIAVTAHFGVRDFLRGRTGGDSTGDGTSSNIPECTPTSTAVGAQILTAYVMLIDANQSVAASATWKATHKLLGPPPPEVTSVSSGNGQISVNISQQELDQSSDGVLLFCDPAPGDPNAAANAQVATGGTGAFIPMCSPSTELVPGADPASLLRLRCGNAYRKALTADAVDLTSGVSYNIAAATVDTYGNIGPLSGVACQVPQAQKSNVRAEACSFAGGLKPGRGSVLWLVVLGAALSRRLLDRGRRHATV
jgi:hypothetical protein